MTKLMKYLAYNGLIVLVLTVSMSLSFGQDDMVFETADFQAMMDQAKTEKLLTYKEWIIKKGRAAAWQYTIKHLDEKPYFRVDNLTQEDYKAMNGKSWHANDEIKFEDLRKVTVTYFGYDQDYHLGQLVVHRLVTEDIVKIFNGAYQGAYPIESMVVIDVYGGDDDASMAANNTSSFNYRKVAGQSNLSLHAYGLAVDVNPAVNPFVHGEVIMPEIGKAYTDRQVYRKGMIVKNDLLYQLFVDNGWTWGGDWKYRKDYQHFSKASVLEDLKMNDD